MFEMRIAVLVVVSSALLAGCRSPTHRSGMATIAGTVTCFDGTPVSQGAVSVSKDAVSVCLVPCELGTLPVLAEQRLTPAGRFELQVTLDDAPGELWILASADAQACGYGYNIETRPLERLEDGQRLELALVISPLAIPSTAR